MCAQTEKTQTTRANLYIYIVVGQGTCKKSRPYPARAYTTLVVLVDNVADIAKLQSQKL